MPIQTEQQRKNAYAAGGVAIPPNNQSSSGSTPFNLSAPMAPTAMTATGLMSTEQPYNLPQPKPQPDASYYNNIIASVPTVDSLLSAVNAPTAADTTQATLSQRIMDTISKLGGRASAQTAAETKLGLPDMNKQLTDITSQLTALKNEADAIQTYDPAKDPANVGRGITTSGLAPAYAQQGELIRQNAIKRLGLSSIASTLQGNIALAQSQANRAVEIQFAPMQQELDLLKEAYAMNKDQLMRQDSKRAAALNLYIADRQQQLDNAREDGKVTRGFAAEAAKNGAPTVLVNQAMQLDPQSALGVLQQYMSDPQAKQQALVELQLKQEQLRQAPLAFATDQRLKNAQIRKANADANSSINGSHSEQLYAGLSNPTATAVRLKVSKFSTEPIIQNFATIQDGYNFASSLDTNTTNPADDQALVYALAKALDPGSVVREGEYATAQKYAQSWINAYGKGITQAVVGTGFLSKTARENIKKTIEQKYISSRESYDQVVSSYTSNINSLTGRGDGAQFLTDYATSQATQTSTFKEGDTQTKNGWIYKRDANGNWNPVSLSYSSFSLK